MNKLWPALLVGLATILSAQAEAPLPAVGEILKQVVARSAREAENDRSFNAQYCFVRSKVTEYRNARGELRKQEAKISTNNPAATAVVAPSKPAPASKSENDQPVSEANSKVKTQEFDKNQLLTNPDILDRFDFRMVGRETTGGRSALVLDFQPKKADLPERKFRDKFINKAAGRVWVDESEWVVMKADLHLSERVNILGGVLGAIWKFTYTFDRDRMPDGLWYVRDSRWHLEGREVIVNRIVDCHETKTNVRKAKSLTQR